MRTLSAFMSISLDGYYSTASGDMSWAHSSDAEFQSFVNGNAKGGGVLMFGRKTYEMMAAYWPTPQAAQNMPVVAERMNAGPKIVFSNSLNAATWNNTQLMKGDLATEVRRLKGTEGPDIVILGSGNLIAGLAELGLIDECQIMLIPVVLGAGKSLFAGVKHRFPLKLTYSRVFSCGNVFLRYEPACS